MQSWVAPRSFTEVVCWGSKALIITEMASQSAAAPTQNPATNLTLTNTSTFVATDHLTQFEIFRFWSRSFWFLLACFEKWCNWSVALQCRLQKPTPHHGNIAKTIVYAGEVIHPKHVWAVYLGLRKECSVLRLQFAQHRIHLLRLVSYLRCVFCISVWHCVLSNTFSQDLESLYSMRPRKIQIGL